MSAQPETDLGTELEGGCVLTVKELRGTFGRRAGVRLTFKEVAQGGIEAMGHRSQHSVALSFLGQ